MIVFKHFFRDAPNSVPEFWRFAIIGCLLQPASHRLFSVCLTFITLPMADTRFLQRIPAFCSGAGTVFS